MLQSDTLSLLLVLGLAGICQVATFGTMPSGWKDMRVSTRGENALPTQPSYIQKDDNFCINLPKKQSTGPIQLLWGTGVPPNGDTGGPYCNKFAKSQEACGDGTKLYRLSSNGNNKYDPCYWNTASQQCLMTQDTYECGDVCFPTAQDAGNVTGDDGKKYVTCANTREEVTDMNIEVSCDCVYVYEDTGDGWKEQQKCTITKKQNEAETRRIRRLEGGNEAFAAECYGKSTDPVEEDKGAYVQEKWEACVPGVTQTGQLTCSCTNKTAITLPKEEIDNPLSNDELYNSELVAEDAVCRNVDPSYWG